MKIFEKHIKLSAVSFLILFFLSASLLTKDVYSQSIKPLPPAPPKNIIIMISDGMGFNHLLATYFYLYGTADSCIFDKNDFISLAQATYPAQLRKREEETVWSRGYDVEMVNNDPRRLMSGATCSGSSATALATGVKTYNGAIGIGIYDDTLVNIVQAAKASNRSAGIVTSVQISHATPAGFVAHNESRSNYAEIASEMLLFADLDVLMGTGNPNYNDNGRPSCKSTRFVGGRKIWKQLKQTPPPHIIKHNRRDITLTDSEGNPNPWTLVQDSIEFASLLKDNPPRRVLGIPKVYATLQQGRKVDDTHSQPFETPFIANLPTLDLMTRGALNILSQNDNGFFLMVEGGAVDWASHSNQSDRMIEEMVDFLDAVESTIAWIENESSWEETMLIVTADHECGFLWGPEGNTFHNPIVNAGKGNIPDMKWYSGSHTNSLVPFFAKGRGAELYPFLAGAFDPQHGAFIQNTHIAQVVFLLWGKPHIDFHIK